MQEHDWHDLKYLLALHRTGRLSAAALRTGANETTVSRRLKRLEAALGGSLVHRQADGRYALTGLGETLLPLAEDTERAQDAIQEAARAETRRQDGSVRITSVPIITNRILVPQLAAFRALHPAVNVDLVAEARNVDLMRRDADIALRFARPTEGGQDLKARKLGALDFATYGPASAPQAANLGWIGYEGMSAALPQAIWTRAQAQGQIAFSVSDAETALDSVAHGLGKAALPCRLADADPRLQRLAGEAPALAREIWMITRADPRPGQAIAQAITQAKAWLTGLDWSG